MMTTEKEIELRLILYKLRNLIYYKKIDTRIGVNYALPLLDIRRRIFKLFEGEFIPDGLSDSHPYMLALNSTDIIPPQLKKGEEDEIYTKLEEWGIETILSL